MPADLKRKSPDLDLDALLADLDATVRASTRRPTTPVKGSPLHRPDSIPARRQQGPQKRDRTRDFSALLEGLDEDDPGKSVTKNTRRTPSKLVTPTKTRPPSTPRRQTPKGLAETDLNALIDGLDWDEFEQVVTPKTVTRKKPVTPRSTIRSSASCPDLTLSASRRSGSARKKRRVTITPSRSGNALREYASLGALCDGLDDMSDFNLSDEDEETLNASTPDLPAKDQVRDRTTRCIVDTVEESCIGGRREKHIILYVDGDRSCTQRAAILKDDWAGVTVKPADVVNLIGEWETTNAQPIPTMHLSTSRNIIIVHPDILVPATSVSIATKCLRKPMLSNLVRSSSSDVTPSTVWGNMLHEVMQSCLAAGNWSEPFVEGKINEAIHSGLDQLVQIKVGFDVAREELKKKSNGIAKFSELYISPVPKPNALLTDPGYKFGAPARMGIKELKDVEETIWSPSYGLKGVVDASVDSRIIETKGLKREDRQWTLPLEIKTGRTVAISEHRAQTMLYTLLMGERYGLEMPAGLLYYTQSEEVIRVAASRNELRGLLISRNEIAAHLAARETQPVPVRPSQRYANSGEVGISEGEPEAAEPSTASFLPPTIDDEWACTKCYNVDACMLYRKTFDDIEDESSPIADLYARKTAHLTSKHAEFFRRWETLISLEERNMGRFRNELWTMSAEARERMGRCFAHMVIKQYEMAPLDPGDIRSASRRHRYTFSRYIASDATGRPTSLLGAMSKGDAVTISIEPNLLALGRGFIADINRDQVVVGIDRELTIEMVTRGRSGGIGTITSISDVVFRIDKDELSTGISRIRDNLAQMFYVKGDARRRSLIVDLVEPDFDDSRAPQAEDLPQNLSASQNAAVRKVLAAQDYALVLGMPGTGKTTTIAEIIKILVSQGRSVLLTSYTHSAVDTILRKLIETDIPVLRLGPRDKVHPEVRKYSLSSLPIADSLETLERHLLEPPVVATTCLSIDHAVFSRRTFDVCIVDEASQITLPTCIGPLRFAERFVLVGDHHQLPPLVHSREARKGGLDKSLFRLLCEAHPQAVVDLTSQYRMNEDIMLLANELIYDNKLTCGTPEVASRTLVLPHPGAMEQLHGSPGSCGSGCWLKEALDPSRKVVFIDTDQVPAVESRNGDLVQNEVEVAIVHQMTTAMLQCGINESQVGIISPYHQQNKLLAHAVSAYPGVEVLTADRSQGRDKDCIILSMTRSNDRGDVGELLKDRRRINVALTRARAKLIIVGSRTTLSAGHSFSGPGGQPILISLMRVLAAKDWILELPPNAQEFHLVDTPLASSQLSGSDEGSDSRAGRGGNVNDRLERRPIIRDVANSLY